jgi:D-methionine transport system ATP-binding protein
LPAAKEIWKKRTGRNLQLMSEIEVKHLSKTFTQKDLKVDALSDININIEKGDVYGIIGMSGAGKSTLVRCLNYLERPTDGHVIVRGQEMGALNEKELRQARMKIAMIFQSFNLLQQKNDELKEVTGNRDV